MYAIFSLNSKNFNNSIAHLLIRENLITNIIHDAKC